jgi:hypothetical protein
LSGPQHSVCRPKVAPKFFFLEKEYVSFLGIFGSLPTTALRSWVWVPQPQHSAVGYPSIRYPSNRTGLSYLPEETFFLKWGLCVYARVHTRTWRHQSTKAITTVFGFELPTGMYTGLALLNPKSKLRWCRRHVRVYSMRVRAIVCACVCDRRALCVRV